MIKLILNSPCEDVMETKDEKSPISGPPIHPISAGLTIILDNIWGLGEIAATPTGIGVFILSIMTGLSGFLGVWAVQRFVAHDSWGKSFAKGVVMGAIAGVPYQVTGTAAGAILLGWAGVNSGLKMLNRGKSDK